MRTFSEVVDQVVIETRKPTHLATIIRITNKIIKELRTNYPSPYDLVEMLVHSGDPEHECPYIIDIPCDYRDMRAVMYSDCLFVKYRPPGLVQKLDKAFWYQSGNKLVFTGMAPWDSIKIAYYKAFVPYTYRKECDRQIKSNSDGCSFSFRAAADDSWAPLDFNDPNQVARLGRHVDWVLQKFPEVVVDGVIADFNNQYGDPQIGRSVYQAFTRGKDEIRRSQRTHLIGEH